MNNDKPNTDESVNCNNGGNTPDSEENQNLGTTASSSNTPTVLEVEAKHQNETNETCSNANVGPEVLSNSSIVDTEVTVGTDVTHDENHIADTIPSASGLNKLSEEDINKNLPIPTCKCKHSTAIIPGKLASRRVFLLSGTYYMDKKFIKRIKKMGTVVSSNEQPRIPPMDYVSSSV